MKFGPFISIFFMAMILVHCQTKEHKSNYQQTIKEERNKKDSIFKFSKKSPLTTMQQRNFRTLDYYSVDSTYQVKAALAPFQDTQVVKMPYTNGESKEYMKYATLKFPLKGEQRALIAYQNIEFQDDPELKDQLFLPFKDHTNGETTYGGGRYIDLKKTNKDSIIIDFNQAYNPYCAYNENYACPIPPDENLLDLKVEAGERKYD